MESMHAPPWEPLLITGGHYRSLLLGLMDGAEESLHGRQGRVLPWGGAYLHCGGRVLARILANSKKSIGFIDGSGGSYLSDPSRRDERHAHGLFTTHYYSLLSITTAHYY